ncbi:CBS domain-containing protein [Actinocorallia sp. API 0066]|uniref:CBS domain-containing protein n=1 Tax=Actinocorallia sp. API 0066 TaxID=2896846 RepID=UPI001E4065B1|nr:CBS domain-containing protein [Actinocorallia sp. API 0066]MCD0450513.1 CBS domain-containing protein [Actinocorallia sp. API 0066]
MSAAWLIRGGRDGEREREALGSGLTIVGWSKVGDVSAAASREDLRALVERAYPELSAKVAGNWTGQLWRFAKEIAVGDLVVMPLHTDPGRLAVGRVSGRYRHRDEAPEGRQHVRDVVWLRGDVARDALKPDLRASVGSLLTVCGLTRNDAARRVAAVAEHGLDPGVDGAEEVTHWQKLLAEAVAGPGEPRRLTVRDLLEHWGWQRRTAAVIELVRQDLADAGLTTRPPFTDGSLDTVVALVPVSPELATAETEDARQDVEDVEDVEAIASVTPHIGTLPPAVIVAVPSTATLQQAVTTMLSHNFSQLAVIDDDGRYHGAVSWESVGRAHVARSSPTLADATARATVVDHDAPLLDLIGVIDAEQFVFVRAADRARVTGIVTASDLTRQFGDHVRPFVLVEEVETRLRRSCRSAGITEEEYQRATRKRWVTSEEQMTLGAYPFLVGLDSCWAKLGWNVDRRQVIDLLKEVARVRNDLMHFSSDKIDDRGFRAIGGLLWILKTVDPRP